MAQPSRKQLHELQGCEAVCFDDLYSPRAKKKKKWARRKKKNAP
jgi:hypothetical protein